ncbi:MAG: sigma-70 family RNA polymerase sigma factor, partial [Hungateiclostridium thermocellum]|nr:sigma-70 family RNA polymerase sigma factor [Acetivibrio thermocellus]
MSSSEKELIKRAKKGDVEAFEQLIEGCQKKVFNIALRMLGNYDDASELAQEVFLKAYKSIKNFKGDSLFNTW